MLRIRLRRVGKKGHPSYRIVVADSRAPRDGAYVEWIGNYDPMAEPPAATIKADRAQAWLSQGAQPSDAVARILDWNGILTRTPTQRNAGSKTAKEAPAEAAPAPAAAAPAVEPEAEETPTAAEDTSEETVAEVATEEAVEEAVAEEAPDKADEEPTSEEESGDSAGDDAEETSEEESSE